MKITKYSFIAALCVFTLLPEIVLAFDYSSAINIAGRQRMLTQKLSKEIMMIANGINVEATQQEATKTKKLFGNSLDNLREEAPSDITRISLERVVYKWRGFLPLSEAAVKRDDVIPEVVEAVSERNMPLLRTMNRAVQMYVREAGSGANQYAEEVNLSGRQRMLTQKMSKEFYLITYGHEVEKNQQSLKNTMRLFESTLESLVKGNKNLGLSPAPNENILAQLKEVDTKWKAFKVQLNTALNGTATRTNMRAVAGQNMPLLKSMNAAVQMYAKL